MLFINFTQIICCTASSVTWNKVLSPWSVGYPYEPISFSVVIYDNNDEIKNVTLYYSLNSTLEEHFDKVSMYLSRGNNKNGIWNYTLEGFRDNTDLYYSYEINYLNGRKDGPTPDLRNPYLWRIKLPENTLFELGNLRITDVDSMDLTVDIEANIHVIWDTTSESITLNVANRIAENYYSDSRYFSISANQGWRYHYIDTINIQDLKLTGDAIYFPFDDYYLDLEFGTYFIVDKYDSKISNVILYEPSNHVWNLTQNKITIEQDKIRAYFSFDRLFQNQLNVLIPLLICCFLLGASHLINVKQDLRVRLGLYTSIIIFMLKFSIDAKTYVPLRTSGISFTEKAFLYIALFFSLYILGSILGNYFSKTSDDEIISYGFDLLSTLISLALFIFYPVVIIYSKSFSLLRLIPNNIIQVIFIFSISHGILIRSFDIYKNYRFNISYKNKQFGISISKK